jgi:hypothetical protein
MLFLASMISGGANCVATGNGRNKLKFPAAIVALTQLAAFALLRDHSSGASSQML